MNGDNLEKVASQNQKQSSNTPKIVKTDVGAKDGQNKCPKCGATEISLNVNTGKLRCEFCRFEFEAEKVSGLEEDITKLEGKVMASGAQDIIADTKDILTFKCSSCGAEVVIDTSAASQAKCHWCRNVLSVNQQIPNGSIPDVVLPFSVTKEDARLQIETFVGKRKFFAHPEFKNQFTTENIMGVYFPYMIVDINSHVNLSGKGEKLVRTYIRGSGDNKEVYYDADLYEVKRDFDLAIDGLTVESNSDRLNNSSSDKTNNVINSIMPFDIENCCKYNANYLMTAHHADDLMETILMRIVRGTSFKGYGGFASIISKGSYKIVRPLIFVTKEQLKAYDDENAIPYVIDKSNFKDKYTRNRYRRVVLPFLKSEDKNVHQKFLKFSNLIYEYDAYIEKETASIVKEVYKNNKLDIEKFKNLDFIIQKRIISIMLEECYSDDLVLINDSHISLIFELINSKKSNATVSLPNDIIVTKAYNVLEIKPKINEICEYEIELSDYCKLPNSHVIEKIDKCESNSNNICRLKYDDISFPLHVRTRRIGDRMKLRKTNGSKKIKDIFIDAKIPIGERDKWPIVVDSKENVIWIPGIKKSKFTKSINEKCDIIFKYI